MTFSYANTFSQQSPLRSFLKHIVLEENQANVLEFDTNRCNDEELSIVFDSILAFTYFNNNIFATTATHLITRVLRAHLNRLDDPSGPYMNIPTTSDMLPSVAMLSSWLTNPQYPMNMLKNLDARYTDPSELYLAIMDESNSTRIPYNIGLDILKYMSISSLRDAYTKSEHPYLPRSLLTDREFFWKCLFEPIRGSTKNDPNYDLSQTYYNQYGLTRNYDPPILRRRTPVSRDHMWDKERSWIHTGQACRNSLRNPMEPSRYLEYLRSSPRHKLAIACDVSGSTQLILWTILSSNIEFNKHQIAVLIMAIFTVLGNDGGHTLLEVLAGAKMMAVYIQTRIAYATRFSQDSRMVDPRLTDFLKEVSVQNIYLVTQNIHPFGLSTPYRRYSDAELLVPGKSLPASIIFAFINKDPNHELYTYVSKNSYQLLQTAPVFDPRYVPDYEQSLDYGPFLDILNEDNVVNGYAILARVESQLKEYINEHCAPPLRQASPTRLRSP